jgi:hypothetical protein
MRLFLLRPLPEAGRKTGDSGADDKDRCRDSFYFHDDSRPSNMSANGRYTMRRMV